MSIHHILAEPKQRAGSRLANHITAAFQSLAFFLIRRFAAAVFVYTHAVAERIGIDPRKTRIFLMSNGANAPADTREAQPQRTGAVYLGRLVPTKGVEDLLRAWSLVYRSGIRSHLTIAGAAAPHYREQLERLCRELGIAESVEFVGNVSETEKSALLNAARVFAFASREEGWGIVLAEAMRHGVPCLTYDLPAYREIFVGGRAAVPLGDVRAFADRLERFLSDDAYQRELAAAAFELARTFTWEHAAALETRALEAVIYGA